MKRDCLLINKEQIPYKFNILLEAEEFTLTVDYNKRHDLFTVGLEKDDETLCIAEPVIYGIPLWQDVHQVHKYPAPIIIPLDGSGQENKVTWDNFGVTVFLMLDNYEEELVV